MVTGRKIVISIKATPLILGGGLGALFLSGSRRGVAAQKVRRVVSYTAEEHSKTFI
jgi:hypothetical protein